MSVGAIRIIGTDTQPSVLPDANSEVAVSDLSNTTTLDLNVYRINPYPVFNNEINTGAGNISIADKSNRTSYNIDVEQLTFNQTTFNTLETLRTILASNWTFIEVLDYPITLHTIDKVIAVACELTVQEGNGTVNINIRAEKTIAN